MSLVYQGIPIPNSASGGTSSSSNRRPGLYIGGKEDAKNYDKLTKYWNVMYILNVTPSKQVGIVAGVPIYFESDNKFKYKRIPIYDNESSASELLHSADAIISFIATGLCHGSVLVHCHHGISRSTTAVLFYLMRRVGLSLNNAMEMIKRRRPQVEPIPAFMNMLQQYEQTCRSMGIIKDDDKNNTKKGSVVTKQASDTTKKRSIIATAPPVVDVRFPMLNPSQDIPLNEAFNSANTNDEGVSSISRNTDSKRHKKGPSLVQQGKKSVNENDDEHDDCK